MAASPTRSSLDSTRERRQRSPSRSSRPGSPVTRSGSQFQARSGPHLPIPLDLRNSHFVRQGFLSRLACSRVVAHRQSHKNRCTSRLTTGGAQERGKSRREWYRGRRGLVVARTAESVTARKSRYRIFVVVSRGGRAQVDGEMRASLRWVGRGGGRDDLDLALVLRRMVALGA